MTERYYQDGTEPTVLPHYMTCHGPCDQGRNPCPCPVACEMEAPNSDELGVFEFLGKAVIIVLALIGMSVVVGRFL